MIYVRYICSLFIYTNKDNDNLGEPWKSQLLIKVATRNNPLSFRSCQTPGEEQFPVGVLSTKYIEQPITVCLNPTPDSRYSPSKYYNI